MIKADVCAIPAKCAMEGARASLPHGRGNERGGMHNMSATIDKSGELNNGTYIADRV